MEHVLSTHIFVNHRLTTFWLEKIWQAGVPAVEIFCARQHLDFRDKAQINELGHWFLLYLLVPMALSFPCRLICDGRHTSGDLPLQQIRSVARP